MEDIKNCPNCNSAQVKTLKGYEKHYLGKCRNCGFVFSQKLPTPTDFDKIYSAYGRKDYLSEITIKRYNEILDSFEKYRKTNKILDIGCGIGYFLEEAKKRNWKVYGSELADKAINICVEKGIQMHKGDLNQSNWDAESFDVITSFELVEHISYPKNVIISAINLLRKGGILYITTPNFNSIVRRRLKAKWSVIAFPEHVSYFTKKSMNFVMTNIGFRKLYSKTHGISITRIYNANSKSKPNKIVAAESPDERIRVSIEKSKTKILIKKFANWILSTTSLGDNLKALYLKR